MKIGNTFKTLQFAAPQTQISESEKSPQVSIKLFRCTTICCTCCCYK